MALFTDGPLNGLQDLQHYENSILEVAGTEGIDLGAKLNLAQDELESQLMLFILRHPLRDMKATIRRSIGLRDVVVTSSLKQWHALATLAAIYRDAYNNQLNDRYLGKWNEYQRLGHIASTDYFQLGVGIVADPIVKAASPTLTPVAGAGAGGSYFVAVSWINIDGQAGAPSDVQVGTTEAGMQLEIAAVNPPSNAANWNVYAGTTASNIALQNSRPIPVGNTWMLPSIVVAASAPGEGQTPEQFLVHDRLLQRG
jgi:hypothetical protein